MSTATGDLSEYLQGMKKSDLFDTETLTDANALPTPELQEKGLERFRERLPKVKKRLMEEIITELLDQASGKIIDQAVPPPVVIPADRKPALHTSGGPGRQLCGDPGSINAGLGLDPGLRRGDESIGIMTPLREDILNRHFPSLGNIHDRISQAWLMGKKMPWWTWALGLWLVTSLWSPLWWVVRAPFRLGHQLWEHHTSAEGGRRSAEEGSLNQENLLPPSALRTPPSVSVPVPQNITASYTEGHKLLLKWTPVGEGYRYKIFRSHGEEEPSFPLLEGQSVNTPGAIVNVMAINESVTLLAVMAVSPQEQESELSQPVRFDLKPWNNEDSIKPLAIAPTVEATPPIPAKPVTETKRNIKNLSRNRHEYVSHVVAQESTPPKPSFLHSFVHHVVGNADTLVTTAIPIAPLAQGINATKNAALEANAERGTRSAEEGVLHEKLPPSALRAPNSALPLPVPTGLEVEKLSNTKVRLSWDSVGPGYRYNYYSGFANDPKSFEIENTVPPSVTENTWSPFDRSKPYIIVVTSIDKNGHESGRSAPVTVDLR